MSINNPLRFAFDFFFTDIMNHCEFLKWVRTLDKNDDVLLISILERLACGPASREGGKRFLNTPVFYQEFFDVETGLKHQDLIKHPVRVARARRHLLDLHGHSYNIFEIAYLNTKMVNIVCAWIAVILQVCSVVLIFWWHLWRFIDGELSIIDLYMDDEQAADDQESIVRNPINENFVPVLMVLIISTALIGRTFVSGWKSASTFIDTLDVVGPNEGSLYLLFNSMVNKMLVGFVLVANIFLLLLSETPTDAIINSAVLYFIIQIDNLLAPTWDETKVDDELSVNVLDFIMVAEEAGFQVFRTTDEHTTVPKFKCFPYGNNDKWYIHVYSHKALIAVHRSIHNDDRDIQATAEYETITYSFAGDESKIDEFFEAICSFKCVECLGDFHD